MASSLVKKLRIKPGQRLLLLDPPEGYRQELGDLPEGVEVAAKPSGRFDFVQFFAHDRAELERRLPAGLRVLKEEGHLWVAFPKGSSGSQTDLTRDKGWDAVEAAGLKWVSLISINDTWSAVGLRPASGVKDADPVEAQYAGKKAALRPLYTRLLEAAQAFGPDVEAQPRKTYVGLARGMVFAVIKPSTATRLDLGLKLPDVSAGARLLEAPGFGSGAITHKVGLTSLDDVDEEVLGWLKAAYDSVA